MKEALLFEAPWERVAMLNLHQVVPASRDPGREASSISSSGDLEIDGVAHRAGTWLRRPAGSVLAMASPDGALVYRKSGHLG